MNQCHQAQSSQTGNVDLCGSDITKYNNRETYGNLAIKRDTCDVQVSKILISS